MANHLYSHSLVFLRMIIPCKKRIFIAFTLAVILPLTLAAKNVEYYHPISTTEQKLNVSKVITDMVNLATCTAACGVMGKQCNGVRYNLLLHDAPKTCELGLYDIENDFDNVFDPGYFKTCWQMTGSLNGCMVRTAADVQALHDIGLYTLLGVRQGDDGVWRWDSDGAAANVNPVLNNGDVEDRERPCARITNSTDVVIKETCKNRVFFACQFC